MEAQFRQQVDAVAEPYPCVQGQELSTTASTETPSPSKRRRVRASATRNRLWERAELSAKSEDDRSAMSAQKAENDEKSRKSGRRVKGLWERIKEMNDHGVSAGPACPSPTGSQRCTETAEKTSSVDLPPVPAERFKTALNEVTAETAAKINQAWELKMQSTSDRYEKIIAELRTSLSSKISSLEHELEKVRLASHQSLPQKKAVKSLVEIQCEDQRPQNEDIQSPLSGYDGGKGKRSKETLQAFFPHLEPSDCRVLATASRCQRQLIDTLLGDE